MKLNAMIGIRERRIAATLAAAFATSAAMAAVSNLESYHFRFDFSKGTANFIPSAEVAAASPNTVTNFVGSNVAPVEGPNGVGNAVHITSNAWQPFESQSILNADWTLAMTFRPGTVEGGTIISLGRIPNTGASAVAICSSSDTSKLYATVVTRNSKGYALEKKQELTGLGDVTQGYHTLVVAYKYATSNKGTLYFYWDGVSKGNYTLTTGYSFGSDSSKSGMQFNQLVTRGATAVGGFTHQTVSNNSDYSLYDVRLYPGQFSDADAAAYAALYPCTYPFRPSAYVESSATNTVGDARNITTPVSYVDTGYTAKKGSEYVLDFQYLDCATVQQYIFGIYNGSVGSTPTEDGTTQCFYINGNNGFAFARFSETTGDWRAITAANAADRIRHIVTVDNADDVSDTGSTATILNWADRSTMATASTTKKHANDAKRSTYLFAVNTKGDAKRFAKARIYSFEADEDGTPALFLAPDMQNGEAGFRNIIDGSFKGDGNKNNNPERTLRFYNGVGCASDYKYENNTLYAKLYATSDGNGTVSVAEGAAAASAEGWVPRGGTLALEAVPAANMEFKEWIGDTWAIADGYSVSNASIEVSTPYAVQLQATFKPAVNALLTIAAGGADAVNWSEADWRNIDNSEETITAPEDKNVTIVAHKSFTLTLDMDVALSNLTVQADANCVVTLMNSVGSLVTVETVVENGVLKQGSANVLGLTPKVVVKAGGTFDLNGLATERSTVFLIAGAGAGDWPWALTTSVATTNGKTVDILELSDDATVGSNVDNMWLGVRSAATFNPATQTLPLTLNGHTLTKTGTGTLQYRRPYSTNEGTIDVQEGTLRMSGWTGANENYGKTCVSNITLVVREGATAVNAGYPADTLIYPVYFKTIDWHGGTQTPSTCAFGVLEALSGHGSIENLEIADGATATLDGNLTVSSAMTAAGALSLTRAAGVETNVTVAATGTLTASGTINVGAGVIFDIGANRPTGTLTVDDDATLVLRQTNLDEDEIVVNASSQPQNIVLYDINGIEIQNPEVSYDTDAGTVTVRAPMPVWTNADGTGLFSAAENWSSGSVPGEGRKFKMSLSGDTTVTLGSAYTFGKVLIEGTGSVGFDGEGSLTLGRVLLTNGVSFAVCGRVTAAGIDLPTGSAATLTTLDGIEAGGVTGVGTLVLAPGAAEAVTISGLSSFTGDFGVTPDHSMTGTLTCEATSLKKFTLNGTTNVVFTLVNGTGGSFKANEVVVAGGVLKQGSASVLSTTPKLTVMDGGTFDINKLKIEDATKPYIAGAGAGDWPWAICSSAGAMVSGNYLANITLQADATIGGPGQLKIGASSSSANKIVLNGHKLTLAGTKSATFRNLNTDAGTIELAPGYIVTLNVWNNLNSDKDNYSGTTLIIRNGARVVNQTDRVIYAATVQLDGGDIWAGGDDKKAFGPLSTLSGHGMIHKLVMPEGAAYKPDGLDYLNVAESLSGTVSVDLSGFDFTTRTAAIPLLKVPTALADTARSSLDLTVPTGWKLNEKTDGGNVIFTLRKPKGAMIIAY